jgi:hypothetical protein
MTVTAELDQFRSLLQTVNPAALTDADHRAMLLMMKLSVEARGIK